MADLSIIVSEIELKLRRLLDEKNQLDKINKSTIVNALDNEEGIEEGRKLIKELVREIDRCVSILNSKE